MQALGRGRLPTLSADGHPGGRRAGSETSLATVVVVCRATSVAGLLTGRSGIDDANGATRFAHEGLSSQVGVVGELRNYHGPNAPPREPQQDRAPTSLTGKPLRTSRTA